MTEPDYKLEVQRLNSDIDEYKKMIIDATNKINELNLRIRLRDSAIHKSKDFKAIIEQDQKIAELNTLLDMISYEEFRDRVRDEGELIKKLAGVRKNIRSLGSRPKRADITNLEIMLADISAESTPKYKHLIETYIKMCRYRNYDVDKETIEQLLCLVDETLVSHHTKHQQVKKLQEYVNRLTKAIVDFSGGETIDDLKEQLLQKDRLIEQYKNKIEVLQFEIDSKK